MRMRRIFPLFAKNAVYRLSPAYDIMSTAIYPEVGRRMAMKVDGEYAFKWITRDKFIRMASKSGIAQRIVTHELDKVKRRVMRVLPVLLDKAMRAFPHSVYATIAEGIMVRMAQI